ncbi:uncharacterized protein LOC141832066 isoform X2 [Curcuma longa]|uniref:uncharacterized protein LOC141832066 isoform X2 n=1 Tax=Curcuma longa TaxID=136217 RepID=UPI003D9DC95F
MDISWEDGKRLCSLMWNKELLLTKKRRILMGSETTTSMEGSRKKLKNSISTGLYLPELYIRNAEVSSETVRTTVERSFMNDDSGSPQMVQDYLRLFQMHDKGDNCNSGLRVNQLRNVDGNKEQFVHELPTSRCCLKSIYNMLEALDEMPFQDLTATNRKLRGESLKPQFSLSQCKGSRDLLVRRLKKKFNKFLSKLSHGDTLPDNLIKALSVIYLSFKHRSRHMDMLRSEFYPFSPETAALHNSIVNALWLIPKFKIDELRHIKCLLVPESKFSLKWLRASLRNYLTEGLFECNDPSITQEMLRVLHPINQMRQSQTFLFSTKTIEEEVEDVMILSCHLKRIISCPFSELSDDGNLLELVGNNENADAFSLSGGDYFLSVAESEYGQEYGSSSNYEAGVSRQITRSSSPSLLSEEANEINGSNSEKPVFEPDGDVGLGKPRVEEEANFSPDRTSQTMGSMGVKSAEKVCDETALVAYKLIGSVLDRLLKSEDVDADLLTRSYLNGGLSPSGDSLDAENILNTSSRNF